jgi:type II secretion system (T2SS) protein M
VTAAVRAWLASRSARERRLLAVAAAGTALVVGVGVAGAIRADLTRARGRVAALERELAAVRRLAGTLGTAGAHTDPSTLARLQDAAGGAGLGDRIAALTPGGDDDRVALRVAGASLAETVRLLHALDAGEPPPAIARLALKKHPDDATRFDLVVEAAGRPSAP